MKKEIKTLPIRDKKIIKVVSILARKNKVLPLSMARTLLREALSLRRIRSSLPKHDEPVSTG